jgi:hypothetical protein
MNSAASATRGPRRCFRSEHVSAPCATCNTYATPVHIPLQMAVFYCGPHCPICAAPPKKSSEAKSNA